MISLLLRVALLFVVFSPMRLAAEPYSGSYPYKATATVGMIGDALKRVGGELLTSDTIIKAGGDPHLYVASPQDVLRLVKADIIFANGLFLEGKMAEILESYGKKKPVIFLGDKIAKELLLPAGDGTDSFDPHLWMDVEIWSQVVGEIALALGEFDPKNRQTYERNAAKYRAELLALHQYVKSAVSSIPAEHRVLVTAHDAFSYFGCKYGVQVRGIQGISTESEAGLKDINLLVDFLVDKKVPAVFVETSVAEKNVQALLEGAKARGHEVKIGGSLYSDAMGAEGTREGTYIGMISHNIGVIAESLGGNVPERGFVSLEEIRGQLQVSAPAVLEQ